jgi:hypothetical protein
MHVPSGSYVIPADIISAMGEGNTMAGFKVAKGIFSRTLYGGAKARPYGAPTAPYGQAMPGKAEGGPIEAVPIVAAGGEYVISPDDVLHVGGGDLGQGHKILDAFVIGMRKKTIHTLKKLDPPKKD